MKKSRICTLLGILLLIAIAFSGVLLLPRAEERAFAAGDLAKLYDAENSDTTGAVLVFTAEPSYQYALEESASSAPPAKWDKPKEDGTLRFLDLVADTDYTLYAKSTPNIEVARVRTLTAEENRARFLFGGDFDRVFGEESHPDATEYGDLLKEFSSLPAAVRSLPALLEKRDKVTEALSSAFAEEWKTENAAVLAVEIAELDNDAKQGQYRSLAAAAWQSYWQLSEHIKTALGDRAGEDEVSALALRSQELLRETLLTNILPKTKRIAALDVGMYANGALQSWEIPLEGDVGAAYRSAVYKVRDEYVGGDGGAGKIDAVAGIAKEDFELLETLVAEARARLNLQAYYERILMKKDPPAEVKNGLAALLSSLHGEVASSPSDYFGALFSLYAEYGKGMVTPKGSDDAKALLLAERGEIEKVTPAHAEGEEGEKAALLAAEREIDEIVERARCKVELLEYYEGFSTREPLSSADLSVEDLAALKEMLTERYRAIDEAEGPARATAMYAGEFALYQKLATLLFSARFSADYPEADPALSALFASALDSLGAPRSADSSEALGEAEKEIENIFESGIWKLRVEKYLIDLLAEKKVAKDTPEQRAQEVLSGLDEAADKSRFAHEGMFGIYRESVLLLLGGVNAQESAQAAALVAAAKKSAQELSFGEGKGDADLLEEGENALDDLLFETRAGVKLIFYHEALCAQDPTAEALSGTLAELLASLKTPAFEAEADKFSQEISAQIELYRAYAGLLLGALSAEGAEESVRDEILSFARGKIAAFTLTERTDEGCKAGEETLRAYVTSAQEKLALERYFASLVERKSVAGDLLTRLRSARDGAFSSVESASDKRLSRFEGELDLYRLLASEGLSAFCASFGADPSSEVARSVLDQIANVSLSDTVPSDELIEQREADLDGILERGKGCVVLYEMYRALPSPETVRADYESRLSSLAQSGGVEASLGQALDLYLAYAAAVLDECAGSDPAAIASAGEAKTSLRAYADGVRGSLTLSDLRAHTSEILNRLAGAKLSIERTLAQNILSAFAASLEQRGARLENKEALLSAVLAAEDPYAEAYRGMFLLYGGYVCGLAEEAGLNADPVQEYLAAERENVTGEKAALGRMAETYRMYGQLSAAVAGMARAQALGKAVQEKIAALSLSSETSEGLGAFEGEVEALLAVLRDQLDVLAFSEGLEEKLRADGGNVSALQTCCDRLCGLLFQGDPSELAESGKRELLSVYRDETFAALEAGGSAQCKAAVEGERAASEDALSGSSAAQCLAGLESVLRRARAASQGERFLDRYGLRRTLSAVSGDDESSLSAAAEESLSEDVRAYLNGKAAGYPAFAAMLNDYLCKAKFENKKSEALSAFASYGGEAGELLSSVRDEAYQAADRGAIYLAPADRETQDPAAYLEELLAALSRSLEAGRARADNAIARESLLSDLRKVLNGYLGGNTYLFTEEGRADLNRIYDEARAQVFEEEDLAAAGSLCKAAEREFAETPVTAVSAGIRPDGTAIRLEDGSHAPADYAEEAPESLFGSVMSETPMAGGLRLTIDVMEKKTTPPPDRELVLAVEISLGGEVGEGKYLVRVLLPKALRGRQGFSVSSGGELLSAEREGDFLLFETAHFSEFYVFAEREVHLWWLVITLASLLVAELAVILVLSYLRRRRAYSVALPVLLTVLVPSGSAIVSVILGVLVVCAGVAIFFMARAELAARRPARKQKRKELEDEPPAVIPAKEEGSAPPAPESEAIASVSEEVVSREESEDEDTMSETLAADNPSEPQSVLFEAEPFEAGSEAEKEEEGAAASEPFEGIVIEDSVLGEISRIQAEEEGGEPASLAGAPEEEPAAPVREEIPFAEATVRADAYETEEACALAEPEEWVDEEPAIEPEEKTDEESVIEPEEKTDEEPAIEPEEGVDEEPFFLRTAREEIPFVEAVVHREPFAEAVEPAGPEPFAEAVEPAEPVPFAEAVEPAEPVPFEEGTEETVEAAEEPAEPEIQTEELSEEQPEETMSGPESPEARSEEPFKEQPEETVEAAEEPAEPETAEPETPEDTLSEPETTEPESPKVSASEPSMSEVAARMTESRARADDDIPIFSPPVLFPHGLEMETEVRTESTRTEDEIRILEGVMPEYGVEPEKLYGAVSATQVNALMADDAARRYIAVGGVAASARKTGIVNVDTLGEYFENGERVTLEKLKERVPFFSERVNYVKVLARGSLDKSLIVEGDDFSLEAVKMILLTGGRVIRTSLRKKP